MGNHLGKVIYAILKFGEEGEILMKKWLRELFCKHEWEHKLRIEKFAVLSGDRFDVVCKKCGKVKGSYFREYNENGTGYI